MQAISDQGYRVVNGVPGVGAICDSDTRECFPSVFGIKINRLGKVSLRFIKLREEGARVTPAHSSPLSRSAYLFSGY
jgi:hypothetical protein